MASLDELIKCLEKLSKPVHINIYDYDDTLFKTTLENGNNYDLYAGKVFGEENFRAIRDLYLVPCGKSYYYRHIDIQENYAYIYLIGMLKHIQKAPEDKYTKEKKEIINLFQKIVPDSFKENEDFSKIVEYIEQLNNNKNKTILDSIYSNEEMKNLTNEMKKEKIFALSISDIDNLLFTKKNVNSWCENLKLINKDNKEFIQKQNQSEPAKDQSPHDPAKDQSSHGLAKDQSSSKIKLDIKNKKDKILKEIEDMENNINEFQKKENFVEEANYFYENIFFPLAAQTEIFRDDITPNESLFLKISRGIKNGDINKINTLKDYKLIKTSITLLNEYSTDENIRKFCEYMLNEKEGINNIIGGNREFVKRDKTKIIDILNQKRIISDIIDSFRDKSKLIKEKIKEVQQVFSEKIKKFEEIANDLEKIVTSYEKDKNEKNSNIDNYINNNTKLQKKDLLKMKMFGDGYKTGAGTDLDNYLNYFQELDEKTLKEKNLDKEGFDALKNIDFRLVIENKFILDEKTNKAIDVSVLAEKIKEQIILGKQSKYSKSFNPNSKGKLDIKIIKSNLGNLITDELIEKLFN